MTLELRELLSISSARHDHLCPRQVLGVRMGLAGMAALDWSPPLRKELGLVIIETDGCFADGIEVATGASVGHRTLRVNDLGKIAATFADVKSGMAVRVSPEKHVRTRACEFAPSEADRYFAQLEGYQRMPVSELLTFQAVKLEPPVDLLIDSPASRAVCAKCGEEIVNHREVKHAGVRLCRSCAGYGYYEADAEPPARHAVPARQWTKEKEHA